MQRVLLSASIFLNICLIVAVAIAYGRLATDIAPDAATTADQGFPAEATFQHQGKTWEAAASEDYFEFAVDLAARGLPERLIQHIIIAEVDALFEPQLNEIVAQNEWGNYWATDGSYDAYKTLGEEQVLAIHGLRRQRELLLQSVLGPDASIPVILPDIANPFITSLNFLPEDKRRRMFELEELSVANIRNPSKDYRPRERIADILTPEEKEEYDLRMSVLAMDMRSHLQGLDLTEYEFREIFRAHRDLAAERGGNPSFIGVNDIRPESPTGRAFRDALKAILGDIRYREYEQVQDHRYMQIVWVAEGRGLDRSVAHSVYLEHRKAMSKLERLDPDSTPDGEARKHRVQQIADELEASVMSILGPEEYEQWGRSWVDYRLRRP